MSIPTVQGYCPACNRSSLFLGDGGYVTCSHLNCPDPSAASDLLELCRENREHCVHTVAMHRRHHRLAVTGCPWCAEDASRPKTVPTGDLL